MSGLVDAVSVSAGAAHACASKADGTVWCWGSNARGQTGSGSPIDTANIVPIQVSELAGVAAVASGGDHSCAIIGGAVWCWGSNSRGQLGDGLSHQICAGSDCSRVPVQVSGLSDVVAIELGNQHSCATRTDGSAWCWGYNAAGCLGDGSNTDRPTPVQVSGLTDVATLSGGWNIHSCATRTDGSAWCWGYNSNGQLGNGNTTNHLTAVQVSGLADTVSIAAGQDSSCSLQTDGSVWCWGYNSNGRLGDGTTTERHLPTPTSGWP